MNSLASVPSIVPTAVVPSIQLPTGTGTQTARGEWNLSNTSLGCGLLILQGWSTGIGIGDNSKLEDKLFLFTYYSANQAKFPGDRWGSKALDGSLEAPISVARRRYQFLNSQFGMVLASHVSWVKRFEKFVRDHDLGEFTYTHSFKNQQYRGDPDCVALWNWNGKHPAPEVFPHVTVVK